MNAATAAATLVTAAHHSEPGDDTWREKPRTRRHTGMSCHTLVDPSLSPTTLPRAPLCALPARRRSTCARRPEKERRRERERETDGMRRESGRGDEEVIEHIQQVGLTIKKGNVLKY